MCFVSAPQRVYEIPEPTPFVVPEPTKKKPETTPAEPVPVEAR